MEQQEKEFWEIFQYVAGLKKMDQADIAKAMEIDRATVNRWWNGKVVPRPKSMRALAEIFECSAEWLKTGRGEPYPERSPDSTEEEPIYIVQSPDVVPVTYVEDTYASAGGGVINYESAKRVMIFDRAFLTSQLGVQHFDNIHIILAVGDSMEPNIHPGDMLFVNPGETEIVTGAVYVFVIGDDTSVKRVERNPISGELTLRSDNEQYQPIKISKKNLKKVHVIGRVIGSFKKF